VTHIEETGDYLGFINVNIKGVAAKAGIAYYEPSHNGKSAKVDFDLFDKSGKEMPTLGRKLTFIEFAHLKEEIIAKINQDTTGDFIA
jgi:hypothetical protein